MSAAWMSAFERDMAAPVDAASAHAWRLGRAFQERDCLCLGLEAAGDEIPSLLLEVRAASPGARAYRVVGKYAFGYRGHGVPRERLATLDRTVAALATLLAARDFDP